MGCLYSLNVPPSKYLLITVVVFTYVHKFKKVEFHFPSLMYGLNLVTCFWWVDYKKGEKSNFTLEKTGRPQVYHQTTFNIPSARTDQNHVPEIYNLSPFMRNITQIQIEGNLTKYLSTKVSHSRKTRPDQETATDRRMLRRHGK